MRGEGAARRLWVAERVSRDGQALGIARASVPMSVVDEHVATVRYRALVAAAIALALSSAMAIVLALGIVRPVRRVAEVARRVGREDLTARVQVATNDEIGDLAVALNDMSSSLQSTITRELERNTDMRRVLDSVDQALLTVMLDGMVEAERSARADEWFGPARPGAKIWDVLDQNGDPNDDLQLCWEELAGVMPLDVTVDQLPKRHTSRGRIFELRYRPNGEDDDCTRLLVIATEITALVQADQSEAVQQDIVRLVERTVHDRAGVLGFLTEADALVSSTGSLDDVAQVRRSLHTLKGNSSLYGVRTIARICEDLETELEGSELIEPSRQRALAASWAAVQARIHGILGAQDGILVPEAELAFVVRALRKGISMAVIADRLEGWKATPVAASLATLGDEAKRLGIRLEKGEIAVIIEDEPDLRLPDETWRPLWGALVHAVRNAVDHGLETPDERAAAAKSAPATVTLSALRTNDRLYIEIADDGRGIDWLRLAEKARERGLPAATHADLIDALLSDGVSTASAVTEISGRGVGMAALREVVRGLGGCIEITSERGIGSRFRCSFPMGAPRAVAA